MPRYITKPLRQQINFFSSKAFSVGIPIQKEFVFHSVLPVSPAPRKMMMQHMGKVLEGITNSARI